MYSWLRRCCRKACDWPGRSATEKPPRGPNVPLTSTEVARQIGEFNPERAVRERRESTSARIAAATQQSDATSTRARPAPMLAPASPERLTVSTTPTAVAARAARRAQIAAHLWENRKANAATTRPQIRVIAPSPEVALTEIPKGPLAHGRSEPNTTRTAAAHANHWLRPTGRGDAITVGAGAAAGGGGGGGGKAGGPGYSIAI
jgi:hypothetical protein